MHDVFLLKSAHIFAVKISRGTASVSESAKCRCQMCNCRSESSCLVATCQLYHKHGFKTRALLPRKYCLGSPRTIAPTPLIGQILQIATESDNEHINLL